MKPVWVNLTNFKHVWTISYRFWQDYTRLDKLTLLLNNFVPIWTKLDHIKSRGICTSYFSKGCVNLEVDCCAKWENVHNTLAYNTYMQSLSDKKRYYVLDTTQKKGGNEVSIFFEGHCQNFKHQQVIWFVLRKFTNLQIQHFRC